MRVAAALSTLLALALSAPAAAAPAPGRLTGRVLLAAGEVAARFTVNGVPFTQGTFDVPLPMGDSRLVFEAEGRAPSVVLVHATARGTSGRRFVLPELVLGSGATLIGEIVDAETGRPVESAVAALAGPPDFDVAEDARPERLSLPGASGRGGAYLIRRAARGEALLVVSHPDYLPAAVRVSTREPLPTVKLQRGGVIEGVARDLAGRPVANARVLAVSDAAGDAQEVRSDPRGAFRMERLRPGVYTVMANGALAGVALVEPVLVREGAATRLELAVAPAGGPPLARR